MTPAVRQALAFLALLPPFAVAVSTPQPLWAGGPDNAASHEVASGNKLRCGLEFQSLDSAIPR